MLIIWITMRLTDLPIVRGVFALVLDRSLRIDHDCSLIDDDTGLDRDIFAVRGHNLIGGAFGRGHGLPSHNPGLIGGDAKDSDIGR